MTDTVTGHTARSAAAVVPVNTLAAATILGRPILPGRAARPVLSGLAALLNLRFIAVPPNDGFHLLTGDT